MMLRRAWNILKVSAFYAGISVALWYFLTEFPFPALHFIYEGY